jgi:hypothetical protein
MRSRSFVAAALIIVSLPLLVNPKQSDAADKMIYWIDGGASIYRANLDGTDAQRIVITTGSEDSYGLAIDSTAGKLYWTEYVTGKIRRSNLNGSQIEDVLTGLTTPLGITMDTVNGRMYWHEESRIGWADLGGTNVHYVNNTGMALGMDVDTISGKLYWGLIDDSSKFERSNLDGSNIETIMSVDSPSYSLALNVENNKIYWTEDETGLVRWANLDGSNQQYISVGDGGVFGLALDTDAGKMYWSCVNFDLGPPYVWIQRANLDGSGIENIVTGYTATSMAIGPVPEPASALLIGAGFFFARLRRRQS